MFMIEKLLSLAEPLIVAVLFVLAAIVIGALVIAGVLALVCGVSALLWACQTWPIFGALVVCFVIGVLFILSPW